jgi:hypothetical protein
MKCKLSINAVGGFPIGIILVLFFFQSCKKDSAGASNNSSGYYLTATVNGESWSANVNSKLNNSPAIGGITSANGVNVVVLLGIKAVNNDSSVVAVIFPQYATLNKTYNFDDSQYSEAAYGAEISPGLPGYYGYNTTSATGGSGTFTITAFDQTTKLIEGSFSGTFGSQNGKPAVQITNGRFRCPYTTDASQLPKSGGVKF